MTDARSDLPGEPGSNTTPPGTPGWVKALGIIVLVGILVFVVLTLAGGEHGPRLHEPTSNQPVNIGTVAVTASR